MDMFYSGVLIVMMFSDGLDKVFWIIIMNKINTNSDRVNWKLYYMCIRFYSIIMIKWWQK
jgi:hypothetical protein